MSSDVALPNGVHMLSAEIELHTTLRPSVIMLSVTHSYILHERLKSELLVYVTFM